MIYGFIILAVIIGISVYGGSTELPKTADPVSQADPLTVTYDKIVAQNAAVIAEAKAKQDQQLAYQAPMKLPGPDITKADFQKPLDTVNKGIDTVYKKDPVAWNDLMTKPVDASVNLDVLKQWQQDNQPKAPIVPDIPVQSIQPVIVPAVGEPAQSIAKEPAIIKQAAAKEKFSEGKAGKNRRALEM